MILRKKLRYSTILMRMAMFGGPLVVCCPFTGRRVLYISMMNDATMEENKLFCKVIRR